MKAIRRIGGGCVIDTSKAMPRWLSIDLLRYLYRHRHITVAGRPGKGLIEYRTMHPAYRRG